MIKKPKRKMLGAGFFGDDDFDGGDEAFSRSAEAVEEVLNSLEDMGFDKGLIIGGALTQVVMRLVLVSPNPSVAIGLLSSCMTNAALAAELEENIIN